MAGTQLLGKAGSDSPNATCPKATPGLFLKTLPESMVSLAVLELAVVALLWLV